MNLTVITSNPTQHTLEEPSDRSPTNTGFIFYFFRCVWGGGTVRSLILNVPVIYFTSLLLDSTSLCPQL